MRMHYTWIAGDINFLPWTCSGPRARHRTVGPCRAGPGRGLRRGWSSARGWVAIHPAYNIHRLRDPGRTGVRDDQHTPAVRPRWWKGGKEGGGDSTGCFVLTRPTTCELLPSFLPTFAYPVILTSGAARCIGAAEKKCVPEMSRIGRRRLANARDLAKRVAATAGVKGVATRRKGERGGKSLDVLSEVFDIPKMICANARGRATV